MFAFDARAARLLAAGDHLTFDEVPGLRLVATAKLRTWVYRFKSPVDGRMRQQRLGHWPAMAPAAALVAWQAARDLRGTGVDPVAQRRAAKLQAAELLAAERAGQRRQAYTVRRLVDEYLASYKGTVAPRTYAELERLFDVELGAIAATPAAELTRGQAFDLLDAMRGRAVVALRLRQGLGAAWDRAHDAGRLPADAPNWWRLVLRGKLKSTGKRISGQPVADTKRVLTEPELQQLLPWLPNFSRDVQDVLTLYLWTLCRGAEIVAMERGEISRETDGTWWTIPRAKLKMRRNPLTTDLRVPLVGRALAVVERRLSASAGVWLFPSTSKKGDHIQQKAAGVAVYWHMPYCQTRKESVRPRLPVTHWAPHDLRRTGRTMLASMGCPAEVGEMILGHLLPGVQGVYDRHHYDPQRREWLTLLDQRLEALASAVLPASVTL